MISAVMGKKTYTYLDEIGYFKSHNKQVDKSKNM